MFHASDATPLSANADISPVPQGQLIPNASARQSRQVLVAPTPVGEMSAVRTKGSLAEVGASSLYQADYYAWTQRMMQTLKARDFAHLDVNNLIEEVDDMGKNVRRGLRSHLANLLMHLLKWQYQSHIQSHSWRASIDYARDGVIEELDDNPSLKPEWDLFLLKAYRTARLEAVKETNLPLVTFPEQCPYTKAQILSEDWLPA